MVFALIKFSNFQEIYGKRTIIKDVIKTKLTTPNVIAGAEIPVSDMQKATFHAATDFIVDLGCSHQ